GWVAPFGYPRINACSRLPVAFRSVPRPSSPPGAKASTECPSYTRYSGPAPEGTSLTMHRNHPRTRSSGSGRPLSETINVPSSETINVPSSETINVPSSETINVRDNGRPRRPPKPDRFMKISVYSAHNRISPDRYAVDRSRDRAARGSGKIVHRASEPSPIG